MTKPDRRLIAALCLFVLGTVLLASAAMAGPEPMRAESARWNDAGELLQPGGYREWVFIGAPLTPNDMNGGKAPFPEFHHVYVSPEAWAAYGETGEFPDGTVIIKELLSVGSKQAASGSGYFEGEFLGLEAAVKSASRHAGEPGHWGFYSFTEPNAAPRATAALLPTASCNTCHQTGGKQDFIFTQYYPVLRAAAPAR